MTPDQAVEHLELPDARPNDLATRARAAYERAVEDRRRIDLAWEQQDRKRQTDLLIRMLQALEVDAPAPTWDPAAGAVALVDGLRFELEHDALVLVAPCPDCGKPMHSFPLVSLADLGALLEREADWTWHLCEEPEPTDDEAEESAGFTEPVDRAPSEEQRPPAVLRPLVEALAELAEGHLEHVRSLVTELGQNPDLDAGVVAYTWIAFQLRMVLAANANPEHRHFLTALPPIERQEAFRG